MKAWEDTLDHVVDGEMCGVVIVTEPNWYHCLSCGQDVGETLSDFDKVRADKACAAWDAEQARQEEDAKVKREHNRKAPLLADALARRRANMARGRG